MSLDATAGRLWLMPEDATFTGPEPMDTPIFDALYAVRFWPLRLVLGEEPENLDPLGGTGLYGPHYVWTAEQERLTMQLAVVVGAVGMDAAAAEVERRERLFTHLRHATVRGGEVHLRTAALESVLHDATKGFL